MHTPSLMSGLRRGRVGYAAPHLEVEVSLDAAVFRADAIDAETAAFNDAFRKAMANALPFHEQEPSALRATLDQGGPP